MRRLEPNLSLHDVLKNSYKDPHDSKKMMLDRGYYLDKKLSNHNQQVYYKPTEKKLLVSVAGTHNIRDWGTDLYLGLGKLKDSNRYKEADSILKQAKQKYNPTNTIVAGHSLGGTIAGYIASKAGGDKAITLDAGYTFGQKTRSNNDAYRSRGDVVSMIGSGNTRMKTLNDLPAQTPLRAHDIGNIKNQNILV